MGIGFRGFRSLGFKAYCGVWYEYEDDVRLFRPDSFRRSRLFEAYILGPRTKLP